MKADEIFSRLNDTDEVTEIEAKSSAENSKSILETICSFSNEPGLGGGFILVGVKQDQNSLFPSYILEDITNLDKQQSDLASQCATIFNIPIRPKITIENLEGKKVIKVHVLELPKNKKPLFFIKDGLPKGAFRRIGPTDHRCTEDDLPLFYQGYETLDKAPVEDSSIEDIDENALERYRSLRKSIHELAEELSYSDKELLESLGCIDRKTGKLTICGLLLFGKSSSQRRLFPFFRVDYIRVPGNKWVQDPDDRFTTIDMRGPLILLLYRIVDSIYSDLPSKFNLETDSLQANNIKFPVKAIREAVTNALMHRSYRQHKPIQIIRYNNRLEIINPGFSLKSEDMLGSPGSEARNPFIAAVFHDTQLAETKGSGINAMRKLLKSHKLPPPTFESDRDSNTFTSRFLLHHFFSEVDLKWLQKFNYLDLNENQKGSLIFVKEVGAINNNTYRQICDVDSYTASTELKYLKSQSLLEQKGKGRGTYYIANLNIFQDINTLDVPHYEEVNAKFNGQQEITGFIPEGDINNTEGNNYNTEGYYYNTEDETEKKELREKLLDELTIAVRSRIEVLKKRETDLSRLKTLVEEICKNRAYTLKELALIFDRTEDYLSRQFIKPLIIEKRINYLYPDMINHPEQAYLKK